MGCVNYLPAIAAMLIVAAVRHSAGPFDSGLDFVLLLAAFFAGWGYGAAEVMHDPATSRATAREGDKRDED